ncbi:MAG: N-formylglutamate amidohydrolase [Desulfomonilia bacterium]
MSSASVPRKTGSSDRAGALRCIITCEHATNFIPPEYAAIFGGDSEVLNTHRGYDLGAVDIAEECARSLNAPLMLAPVSRLLVDLNRSLTSRELFSEFSWAMDPEIREEIVRHYYLPYREQVEKQLSDWIGDGMQVYHLSVHSFSPIFSGTERKADIGLLYDPARDAERAFCSRLITEMRRRAPGFVYRRNYPYKGTADGFTRDLRKKYPPRSYIGIEVEVNQKHHAQRESTWKEIVSVLLFAIGSILSRA